MKSRDLTIVCREQYRYRHQRLVVLVDRPAAVYEKEAIFYASLDMISTDSR